MECFTSDKVFYQSRTDPYLGGAGRQDVPVVGKPGDVEGSKWLQLRLGRHKPPLNGGREDFPLQNRSLFLVFTKIIIIRIRNVFYCPVLKHADYVSPLISLY